MDDLKIAIERHEQRINPLEKEIKELHDIRIELRTMSEMLVALASEMKHANEHLARNERKIDLIESQPKIRLHQIIAAIVSALSGVLVSAVIGGLLG